MTFSDDDLKRLKEGLIENTYLDCTKGLSHESLKALLARLEAAEKVCKGYMSMETDGEALDVLWRAWRKAAGKI